MSTFTDIRNEIESIFSPAAKEALNFVHALETDIEGAESAAIEGAFLAGTTAYEAANGTLEVKALAALAAIGSSLLGEAVTVVKQAASSAVSATPAPTPASAA